MNSRFVEKISCMEEELWLLPQKAVFWPKRKTLVIADLHLGKSAYFRKSGIQIPSTVMDDDLLRLGKLMDAYKPSEIIIAGDMFHHSYNADILKFQKWRQAYADVSFQLVAGNHDKLQKIDYRQLNIIIEEQHIAVDSLVFEHETKSVQENMFHISGHLHPGYIMEGKAKQALRLPCFIYNSRQLILPAFSAFTGLFTGYKTATYNQYFVIVNNEIFKIG